MTIGERIKHRREELNMTQQELAEKIGYKGKTAVSKLESGERDLRQGKILPVATALNTTVEYIMGWDDPQPQTSRSIRIPVYGRVAAGIPMSAIENIVDYEEIPDTWTGVYGALKVKGDSMAPRIQDGDTLIVKIQDDAESGDVVVALINGEDATVKKLVKKPDGIVLQPFNPAYEPMYFSADQRDKLPVIIWGKVVENRQKF